MVGAQSGTTGETIAQENVESSNYNTYDSYVFAVQDLQNGNIDAVVLDVPVARTFADQRPVEIAFVEETGERYGFGIREGERPPDGAERGTRDRPGLRPVRGDPQRVVRLVGRVIDALPSTGSGRAVARLAVRAGERVLPR